MTTLREAAQQALEALEVATTPLAKDRQEVLRAQAALRAALAQQKDPTDPGNDVDVLREHVRHLERRVRQLHAQQEPVQEPVAWRYKPMIGSPWSLSDDGYYISCKRDKGYIVEPLYAAPPQRTMVPLTEEEIERIGMKHVTLREVIRAVERAHGIKEN